MRNKKILQFIIVFFIIIAWIFSGFPTIWQNPRVPPETKQAKAVATNMLLFWDGASAPVGWTIVTTYDGKFPRGESAANFGTTGGNATHAPTVSSVTNSTSSAGTACAGGTTYSVAPYSHIHTSLSVTVGSASNFPYTKGYKLIQYTGIPVSIPTGAIAIFDTSAPSGWTSQVVAYGSMIQASSSVGTFGSDTHQHLLTWASLGATTTGITTGSTTSNAGATAGHTHGMTTNPTSNTASVTALPPYIHVVIAKVNATTSSLTNGMIAMFDADPGSAWTINSNSGGAFYQKFIRASTTYSASPSPAGATTHNHAAETSGASDAASNKARGTSTSGTTCAGPTHTHTLTANFNTGTDNVPPYFNVVYAKKNTNVAPNAPSQDSPANSATGVSVTPTFTMTATDPDPDHISYKVTIYSNSACTAIVGSAHDQSTNSTGWSGTDATCTANPTSCYNSGTQGSFALQSADALSYNTQYWWKASAKDPDGSGTFTDSSTCNTFTTLAASLTFSVSTTDFPSLTPGSTVFATSTLNVNTNNSSGWNVTVSGDNQGSLTASTTMYRVGSSCPGTADYNTGIPDQTEWIPASATTTAGNAARISSLGNSQNVLAFRVMTASGTASFISTAWWGSTDSYADSATTLWAGIASSSAANLKIGNSSVSSGGSNVLNTVLYYLKVPDTQQTGCYQGPLTFTATMNP